MSTYQTIKQAILSGDQPTVDAINVAIAHQTEQMNIWARSMSKHLGKLVAAEGHPFPLPEDQKGRVARRLVAFQTEQARLVRLFAWRELAILAPRTAQQGVGSA